MSHHYSLLSSLVLYIGIILGYQREANLLSDEEQYEWRDAGWTSCTESCLGGLQETKIIRVESENGTPVSPINCGRTKQRPDVIG